MLRLRGYLAANSWTHEIIQMWQSGVSSNRFGSLSQNYRDSILLKEPYTLISTKYSIVRTHVSTHNANVSLYLPSSFLIVSERQTGAVGLHEYQ